MWGLGRGLRQAARSLLRRPGFTFAAAATLAIGFGAVAGVFAVVDGILLAPLPYPGADRLVAVGHVAPGVALEGTGLSDGTYLHYRERARSLVGLATYHDSVVNLAGDAGAEAERVAVATVTSDFFAVLGVRAHRGRLPLRADADGSGERVVLVSHDLWQRRYGGADGFVGATIAPNRVPRRVIGILPPGFGFPRPDVELWFPADPDPATARAADLYHHGIGRLAADTAPADAQRELDGLLAEIPSRFPDLTARVLADARLRAAVRPLAEVVVGRSGRALWLLLGGMAFLLVVACANVANLFLVRAEHRQRELAVRVALGAGGGRLRALLFAESLLIAALGGAAGLLLAAAGTRVLVVQAVSRLPRLEEVAVGGRAAALVAVLVVAAAAALAALPLPGRGRQLGAALRERAGASSASRQGVRRLLVAVQVALALTLLTGALLLGESFRRLMRADPGFDPGGVLTAELALPRSTYGSYESAARFWQVLVERVEAVPGVRAAGMAGALPLVPQPAFHDLALELADAPDETRAAVSVHHVSTGYFAAMGIPVVAGAAPGAGGAPAGDRPVVLSRAAARRLFPGTAAVGRRLRRAAAEPAAPWATVAAVVGDVPRDEVGGAPAEIVYVPIVTPAVDDGLRPAWGTLVVRTSGDPAALGPAIRQLVRDLDPHLPLANVRTLERIVAGSAARTTFVMALLGVAAAAALLLGAVGLYGFVAYTVDRRRSELGIRLALGARGGEVGRAVLGESLAPAAAGIAGGVVASLLLAGALRGLLYGVRPAEPLPYAATIAVVAGVVLIAAWLPARRATRLDPVRALRESDG